MILKYRLGCVLLICWVMGFGEMLFAQPGGEVTFRKIAAIGEIVPGASQPVKAFQEVATSKGNVVFLGIGRGVGGDMHYGVYGFIDNVLTKIAETGDEVPGGGSFTVFAYVGIDRKSVVFRGISKTQDGERHEGIYLFENGKIRVIADDSMSFPGSNVTFNIFFKIGVYDGEVVFRASGNKMSGIYKYSNGSISRIADESVPIPESEEVFAGVMEPEISKGTVVFKGYQHTVNGIFMHDGDGIATVADTRSKVPGKNENFSDFTVPSNDGKTVAFWSRYGERHNGIYVYSEGKLSLVADDSTGVPGRNARFQVFHHVPSISNNRVAFMAQDSDGIVGLYLSGENGLRRVIDSQSMVQGGPLIDRGPCERIWARNYDDGHLVFVARFSDRTSAIYLADIP